MITFLCIIGLLVAIAGAVVQSGAVFAGGAVILALALCTGEIVNTFRGGK